MGLTTQSFPNYFAFHDRSVSSEHLLQLVFGDSFR